MSADEGGLERHVAARSPPRTRARAPARLCLAASTCSELAQQHPPAAPAARPPAGRRRRRRPSRGRPPPARGIALRRTRLAQRRARRSRGARRGRRRWRRAAGRGADHVRRRAGTHQQRPLSAGESDGARGDRPRGRGRSRSSTSSMASITREPAHLADGGDAGGDVLEPGAEGGRRTRATAPGTPGRGLIERHDGRGAGGPRGRVARRWSAGEAACHDVRAAGDAGDGDPAARRLDRVIRSARRPSPKGGG